MAEELNSVEEVATEEKTGFKKWIEEHQTAWEFILFNILSNVSTVSRFVVTWIGTAITGGAGTVVVCIAEIIAQAVNYVVQMKWVFKSDASWKESAPKYAALAILIIVMNTFLVPMFGQFLVSTGVGKELVDNVIVPVTGTLLAVIISFPLLKFWIAPASKKDEETVEE